MAKISIEEIGKLFDNQNYDEVLKKLLPIAQNINATTDIPMFNVYYLVGKAYRFKKDLNNASHYLKKSIEIQEDFLNSTGSNKFKLEQTHAKLLCSNLIALGVVYQQMGKYEEAIKLLIKSLEMDDTNPMTWNSLALTQKYMKQYDKAEKNYETGIEIYTKNIVNSLKNSRDAVLYPHPIDVIPNNVTEASLWIKYSLYGAIYLSVKKKYDSIGFPTGKAVVEMLKNKTNSSLYWSESIEKNGKKIFVVRPNYFNTFLVKLSRDTIYYNLIGNKSVVLELQGKEESKKYYAEAQLFRLIFKKLGIKPPVTETYYT